MEVKYEKLDQFFILGFSVFNVVKFDNAECTTTDNKVKIEDQFRNFTNYRYKHVKGTADVISSGTANLKQQLYKYLFFFNGVKIRHFFRYLSLHELIRKPLL